MAAQHIIAFGSARSLRLHDAYPPGMNTLNYLLLKHVKPVDAHHGTMLPFLRLTGIAAWMLVAAIIALLGSMALHPLTGLMAAGIWIVNPWVVERAHWALPDGYLTLFTLLSLWLCLVGFLQRRHAFSTAATYCLMLAIVFKTQAIFVAPIVVLMPLLGFRGVSRREALEQTFWNCVRFGFFLFWLILIYPTLESFQITHFAVKEANVNMPSVSYMFVLAKEALATFQPLSAWIWVAPLCLLLWRYRQRISPVAFLTVVLAAVAWLAGLSMFTFRGSQLRQLFAFGAFVALSYAAVLTVSLNFLEEALTRPPPPPPPFSIIAASEVNSARLRRRGSIGYQPAASFSRIRRPSLQLFPA